MVPATSPWPSTEPDRAERLKLVVAVTGLIFFTLLGWLILSYFRSFLQFLYTLWGILFLLGLLASAIAFVIALAFVWRRKRPPTVTEAPATLDSVGTRPM